MDELRDSHGQPLEGDWLVGVNDEPATHQVVIEHDSVSHAIVRFAPATESRFFNHAGLSHNALSRSLAITGVWLSKDANTADHLAPALYRALQQGRIWGLNTVVAHIADLEGPVAKLLRLGSLSAAPEVREGRAYQASVQMLDVAIYEVARACSAVAWSELRPLLAREAVETVQHWVKAFYRGSWSRSIFERTMTREQYVQSLSNMHHYVRQTTQHLGRAVASADNRELRRHFIEHLNGEINHEVMIENDLRHLGVDPEYVVKHRVPNAATKSFMAIQETTIAFYQDPIMLMACPLVAEGITANMPAEFVSSLRALVGSWGVKSPERATGFLTSHTHTDGGEDGHWQATVEILHGYLVDEATQRRFLCTLRTAADCIERSFNSNIDDLPLFGGAA
jgi:thiaminase